MCSFEGISKKKCLFYVIGDWSSGMIGVSKTFGGGSIPSSPVEKPEANASGFFVSFLSKRHIYVTRKF